MAARATFYVYRIFDGFQTLYVGKGSGKRIKDQIRRFGCDGEIIEHCKSDDHAFAREIHWIKELHPTENKCAGGNGKRVRPQRKPRISKEMAEINRVGSRRYVAQFLLTKLSLFNCEQFGLSKVDLFRLQEVANGPRC